ncbi:Pycsar system effector family protein [Dokdonella sp.]|uniref:Pycsar system effector family protein n=1 Tax=Dokdonella sp. TaxID=2291710 RepID=UPI0037848819
MRSVCRSEATMDEQATPAVAAFARIPERNTGDNLLRTAQQHHVALSSMADTKANIIITVSSIVLTISIGRLNDPQLRVSMLVLACFTLAALLLAILAVLPKYRSIKVTGEQLPSGFNLLFFGHFSELSRERYLTEMARALTPDGSPYYTWSNDIYSVGTYLRRYKYRYLRYSYLLFLTGFVLSCVLQGWQLLTH